MSSAGNFSPLVTIVVPSYNAASTVAETISSLEKQTYENLEVIIMDDGSKDDTKAIVEKIVARNPTKLRYVHQENAGQATALNNGWSHAKGAFLGYLSADDILYPEAIKELVEFLQAHPSTYVVYPDYDLIDANSKLIRPVQAPDFNERDLIERSICQPGPGALFRKEAFTQTGGWNRELRLTPDFDFWVRVTRYGSIARLAKNLAGFRVHEESQSFAPPSEAKSEEATRVIGDYFAAESENGIDGSPFSYDRAMAWAHVLSARLHLRAGRFFKTFTHLIAALKRDPVMVFNRRFWHLLASGAVGRLRYRLQSSTRKS